MNPDATRGIDLELDPHHPGISDPTYLRRRRELFDLARTWRLEESGIPEVEYEAHENEVWRHVSARLADSHERAACAMYRAGKRTLSLPTDAIPSLIDLDATLQRRVGLGITPAEGLIDFRAFFGYLARRRMPCTQYVRHGSRPEYTPEPDVIHDVIGHVPMLADRGYSELLQTIGDASQRATEDQLLAFNRLYWFTIEFGLIEEDGALKIFGAGLLSSFGEMQHCTSDAVERRALDMRELVARDYDPTHMQHVIYVIPSFAELVRETHALIGRLGL